MRVMQPPLSYAQAVDIRLHILVIFFHSMRSIFSGQLFYGNAQARIIEECSYFTDSGVFEGIGGNVKYVGPQALPENP